MNKSSLLDPLRGVHILGGSESRPNAAALSALARTLRGLVFPSHPQKTLWASVLSSLNERTRRMEEWQKIWAVAERQPFYSLRDCIQKLISK